MWQFGVLFLCVAGANAGKTEFYIELLFVASEPYRHDDKITSCVIFSKQDNVYLGV